MASVSDIVNLAFSHLGEKANVVSISPPDATVKAQDAAKFYPIARDFLLEKHPWRFARKRIALSELDLGDAQPASWAFAYAFPSSCIKVNKVLMPAATDDSDSQDFDVETKSDGTVVIYTNVEQAVAVYTALVTDTSKFTPMFVAALARLLASYLAGPTLKGETGRSVALTHMKLFLEVDLPAATGSDSNARQSHPYTSREPESIAARR